MGPLEIFFWLHEVTDLILHQELTLLMVVKAVAASNFPALGPLKQPVWVGTMLKVASGEGARDSPPAHMRNARKSA